MSTNSKQKTPLHLRLTSDDWLKIFNQLDRSELGVFYYIKTQDPFGDRVIEINSSSLAISLGIHRTSVSRALKSLSQKGLIYLEITSAKVSTKVAQKIVCMDAQGESVDAQQLCMDAQGESVDAQQHNIDRARDQTIQTNTNFDKTLSEKDSVFNLEIEVEPELELKIQATFCDAEEPKTPLIELNDGLFGAIIPASFDNSEQLKQQLKIERYRRLESEGVKLPQFELQDWAKIEIGEYVKVYRKSGVILTGGKDISNEFAIFVAKQNCKKGEEATIALGLNVINKCERDSRSWQKLVVWVIEFTQQTNIATTVTQQQRSLEIDEVLAGL